VVLYDRISIDFSRPRNKHLSATMLTVSRRSGGASGSDLLQYRLVTAEALLHPNTAFVARHAVSTRTERHSGLLRRTHHTFGCGRCNLYSPFLFDSRVAVEALFHSRAALGAGDTMAARKERDLYLFRGT
jgi:hypothetical protein